MVRILKVVFSQLMLGIALTAPWIAITITNQCFILKVLVRDFGNGGLRLCLVRFKTRLCDLINIGGEFMIH